jgi:hypothetical protein
MRRVAGLLVVVALAGACATAPAPASPSAGAPNPPGAEPNVGCLGLDEAGCQLVSAAILAALPANHPPVTYIQAGPFYCQNQGCRVALVHRPKGEATVELAAGEPIVFDVAAVDGRLEVSPRAESFMVAVSPTSGRLEGPIAPAPLGHCGLFSGIDLDGSFWDPVGLVDADHSDAINSAEATFTLMTPTTAVLITRGGLVVELVRHEGPKSLPGCM